MTAQVLEPREWLRERRLHSIRRRLALCRGVRGSQVIGGATATALDSEGHRGASGLARPRSAAYYPQRMDFTLVPHHTSRALYGGSRDGRQGGRRRSWEGQLPAGVLAHPGPVLTRRRRVVLVLMGTRWRVGRSESFRGMGALPFTEERKESCED